ncbi:MAG: single-stranded DNA-binding protein [Thermodesulfovibrio sp.]|uniref:single-stranded DNA-binding protein n=1 Tax=unclassified Thermodesulfovibrio TaxID=2645936 RepID=UPI00083B4863|nr:MULTISPECIES: single-stranded DNA-binding protein [unclassified Thermodesulfovibrio]MDI1472457.1 single-stranded DNA-binding protein [Thermodesulfovibrio sp. 1176]MDI6714505.1 single-stranded DNA-binding protein [Thermodesulfovibrio sp.]ODA43797.1 Single-stranded DNA-binding protein [Thermodesulfovibrio sp. N1]
MYNRIILIGNLTRDPEIRYTPTGVAVATVPIAVNSRYRQGEELKEETLFIDAVVFGKQAETCTQYLNKGRMVLVEGRLRERRWEYEGQKRSKFEIIASNIRFLPKRETTESHEVDQIPPEEYTDLEPF